MIGLDTNVVLRYVMQDDPEQSGVASALMDSLDPADRRGYVSVVALVELHWVLRRADTVGVDDAANVVRRLLEAAAISVAEPDCVRRALLRAAEGAGFADALRAELGTAVGCTWTATFDERTSRLAGMRLLPT